MDELKNCSSCSKENYNMIPITRVIEKLNSLFAMNDLDSVGRLLDYWETEARNLRDDRGLLEILNEEIGYFRRVGKGDKALNAVNEAFEIIEKLNIGDTVSSATVYLNGATTMKAFGKAKEAIFYYKKTAEIYDRELDEYDYKMAALYNNMSSAFSDLGERAICEECCFKAIEILEHNERCNGEIAVTLVNLAHLYHESDPFDERIYEFMDKAWELLVSNENEQDGNFAFLCSKCAPSFGFFGYFEKEAELKKLTEKIYARS